MQALYAMWNLGKLLGAPIAGPFLSHEQTQVHQVSVRNHSDAYYTSIGAQEKENTRHHHTKNSMIYVPFIIVASFLFLAALLFAAFQILEWTFEKIAKVQEKTKDNKPSKQDRKHLITEDMPSLKIVFLLALFFIYISIAFRDNIYALFLFAIGVTSSLEMSKSSATFLLTTYSTCGAAGGFAAVIYSYWINVHVQLYLQLVVGLVLCVLTALWALESVVSSRHVRYSLSLMNMQYFSQLI